MAKLKFKFQGTESGSDLKHAKPGLYKAKIKKIEEKESKSSGNEMLEITLEILPTKKGYSQVWYYIVTGGDNPQEGRLREFLEACGVVKKGKKNPSGAVDLDKLVGLTVQVNLKSDTDQDGEYRPRVGKILGLSDEEGEEPEDDEDEDEDDADIDEDDDDEEDDDDDDEEDEEDEDEEYDEDALEALDNDELKAVAAEFDIEPPKRLTDKGKTKLIAAILEAQEASDEDDDDEDDEDDDDEDALDADAINEMDLDELKEVIEENDLSVKTSKKVKGGKSKKRKVEEVRADVIEALELGDDDDEEDDDKPDYDSWSLQQLKDELKERGLNVKGKKDVLIGRLEKDDESDSDPFDED